MYNHASEQHDLQGTGFNKTAQVGLLSQRNIVIQGGPSSGSNRFGVHVSALAGSIARISGVQITNAGQRINGSYYQYPVQWKNSTTNGVYLKQSSISGSYQGCVGIVGSLNVLVSGNICFNFSGDGYSLDTGRETGNTFTQNLGIQMVCNLFFFYLMIESYTKIVTPHFWCC